MSWVPLSIFWESWIKCWILLKLFFICRVVLSGTPPRLRQSHGSSCLSSFMWTRSMPRNTLKREIRHNYSRSSFKEFATSEGEALSLVLSPRSVHPAWVLTSLHLSLSASPREVSSWSPPPGRRQRLKQCFCLWLPCPNHVLSVKTSPVLLLFGAPFCLLDGVLFRITEWSQFDL